MSTNPASDDSAPAQTPPPAAHFEIYLDTRGQFRIRLVANAGKTVFSSEGYPSRSEAMKAIESIRRVASTARIGRDKPSLVDHILSGPEWPDDMYEEVNRRSKEPSRPPIEF